jgi:hypothetical protein
MVQSLTSINRPPSYTADEISTLRITRMHFRQDYMFCLLSDANMLCVPLAISPPLKAAPIEARYEWQITADGQTVVWRSNGSAGQAIARLGLRRILSHPKAYLAGSREGRALSV